MDILFVLTAAMLAALVITSIITFAIDRRKERIHRERELAMLRRTASAVYSDIDDVWF